MTQSGRISFLIFSLLLSFASRQKKVNRGQENVNEDKIESDFICSTNSER